jgi:type VI secretion system ImpM family protein
MTNIKYSPGCFGKLPKFADFVKFNSGNSELLFFDKWIQNGLQYSRTKLGPKFDSDFLSADSVQFIFPIPNSPNNLIGTFISSNDKSGRKYPFIISSPINAALDSVNVNLHPLVFDNFFSNSEKLITQLKEIDKHEEIIAVIENNFDNNEVNFTYKKLHYQEYTNITTTQKLWSRLFGNFEDDRKYIMIYNLTEILMPLRNKQINNFTLGLKIPIVSESEFMYSNISFWVEFCLKCLDNSNIRPYIFWLKNSLTLENNLILYLNQPLYDTYLHLIDQNILMDNICFTEKEGNIENCKKSLDDKYIALLEKKELSLSQFLMSI